MSARYMAKAYPHPTQPSILRPAHVVWDNSAGAICHGFPAGMTEAQAIEAAAFLNRAYDSVHGLTVNLSKL